MKLSTYKKKACNIVLETSKHEETTFTHGFICVYLVFHWGDVFRKILSKVGCWKKDNKGEFKLSAHYVWNYLKNQHQGTLFYLLRTKQLKDWTINYFLTRYNQHYSRMVQL